MKAFDGRLLLHTEADDGSVHPVWEAIESDSCVQTLREVMDEAARKANVGVSFVYKRIPITAEKSPDFADIRAIVELVAQLDVEKSAIIVNCQLGMLSGGKRVVLSSTDTLFSRPQVVVGALELKSLFLWYSSGFSPVATVFQPLVPTALDQRVILILS